MKSKPIIIVPGEPKSIFFEILFKSLKSQNFKSPLILITSIKILKLEMIKNKFKKKINFINSQNLVKNKLNNSSINLIDINYNSSDSNHYIKNCFDVAFKILKSGQTYKFINGPINKSIFLSKKFLGVTEYISKKFNIKKNAMLIFNKDLSVCPVTTHLPIKLVAKKISKKLIYEKISLINGFFKKNFGFKPKIAVTGLNPHCESILKFNEDKKIVEPAVKNLKKKGFNVFGPFSDL